MDLVMPCSECGLPLPTEDPRAYLCSGRCRARRHRRLAAARAERARSLLRVQTRLLLAEASEEEIAAVLAEVERLVG
ncbi:hypothetical protein GCM10009616_11310 [Microlunatus lacustris]